MRQMKKLLDRLNDRYRRAIEDHNDWGLPMSVLQTIRGRFVVLLKGLRTEWKMKMKFFREQMKSKIRLSTLIPD